MNDEVAEKKVSLNVLRCTWLVFLTNYNFAICQPFRMMTFGNTVTGCTNGVTLFVRRTRP